MNQGDSTAWSPVMRRVIAGMEALILAGILYLIAADRKRERDMIVLQTTSNLTAQAVSNLPDLNVRVVKLEGDMTDVKRRITSNEGSIEALKDKARLK